MGGPESITRSALDTLPSQIAILEESGRILFTNSTWGEVPSEMDGRESDAAGANYFASVDPSADEYAVEAVRGIRAVLDGERDSFSFEYPCETPTEDRWFLMRATRFTHDGTQYATVAHIEITDRRRAEMDAQENAAAAERERRHLEHLVDRINGLVQDITKLLVEAVTREEVVAGVCDRLAATDPYVHAWIGTADIAGNRLEPSAAAGTGAVDTDEIELSLATDDDDPSVRALTDGTVHIRNRIEGSDCALPYEAAGVESVMAIPLDHRETTYGVLTVGAATPDAFDEREQVILEALGRAIANALSAIESRRTLEADRVVELEFTVDDDSLFPNRLSSALDCHLSLSGSVYSDEGAIQAFYEIRDVDPEVVLSYVTEDEVVVDAQLLSEHDGTALVRVTLERSLIEPLLDRGAAIQGIETENGVSRASVELSQEADAKALFESVADRYGATDLVGYHEHERPVQTRQEFRADLEDRLTERQLTALRTAYISGFFDWPRTVDGDELSAAMNISRSTFHQHLRVAERKVLETLFDQ